MIFFNFSQSETKIANGDHVSLSTRDEMRIFHRGPYIDAFCKTLLYLAKWFQRRRYLDIDQPETIFQKYISLQATSHH